MSLSNFKKRGFDCIDGWAGKYWESPDNTHPRNLLTQNTFWAQVNAVAR
jgi:hypothetical protein